MLLHVSHISWIIIFGFGTSQSKTYMFSTTGKKIRKNQLLIKEKQQLNFTVTSLSHKQQKSVQSGTESSNLNLNFLSIFVAGVIW